MALLPWASFPAFPFLHPHAQWADVVFALAAAVWLSCLRRSRGIPRTGPWPPHAFSVAVLVYVSWATLSWCLASPSPGVPRAHILGLMELGTLALLAAALGGDADVRRGFSRVAGGSAVLLAAAAVGGVILSALGTDTLLVGGFGDLEPGPYRRAQAGTWHPNLLASLCVFFWVGVAQDESPWSPRARRILTGLLVLTVALTVSRTLLSFGVALLARRLWGTSRRGLAVATAFGVAALFVALTLTNLRLDPTRPWEARLEETSSPRRAAVSTAWRTFAAHPLLGIGPGRSPGHYEGFPMDAHLTPLNLAATLGLPGLLAFVALPLVAWRTGARDAAPWCALLALGLDALTEDVEEFRHLFLLLGLAGARWGPEEQATDCALRGARDRQRDRVRTA